MFNKDKYIIFSQSLYLKSSKINNTIFVINVIKNTENQKLDSLSNLSIMTNKIGFLLAGKITDLIDFINLLDTNSTI